MEDALGTMFDDTWGQPVPGKRRVILARLVSGKAADTRCRPNAKTGEIMARRKPPRVAKHWNLLKQMQNLIQCGMKPRAAAVKVAKEHWHCVSKTRDACVQWLKDNQRKFREELDPIFALEKEFEAARLEQLKKLSSRERERYEREQEQRLRERDEARKAALKWDRDHPKEAAERAEKLRRAADARERKIERWHEWFRDDPKAALAQLLDEIKRDEASYDD
jgi:hypothetical protein